MLIQRIVDNLRKRSWSTVILELFTVIVGVFAGIQVSNWNDERLDRQRAHEYLERILVDIETDIANYEDKLAFWGRVHDYGSQALDYAESGDLDGASYWDLLLAYFQASQLAEYYTRQATYEELKSGGELGLIGDITLRNHLARYYSEAGNPVLTERPVYREHVRGLIPLDIQDYIWNRCYWANDLRQQLLDCDAPVEVDEARLLVERISGDGKLMQELRYWMSTMRVARIIGEARTGYAHELRAELRDVLRTGAESTEP